MMREFKFIRGIYKNESVLSQDETRDTLFALYGDGSSILLDTKNDEDFQKKIVGLKSDKREIYTIRPSQFKATATKNSLGNYTLKYDLDGSVYDNSMKFPDNVKNAAVTLLGEKTAAVIPDKPSLILSGDSPKTTPVEFTYDNKSFTKNLYFRVFGDVAEFSITAADDNNTITAYNMIDGNVIYNDPIPGIFHNGKKQEKITPSKRDIAKYEIVVSNTGSLGVASQYKAETGFKFLIGQQLLNVVKYSDNLTFDLYNRVGRYLTLVDANVALNGNSLGTSYVAYRKDRCPSKTCYTENPFASVFAYSEKNCVLGTFSGDQNDYSFYEIHEEPAYILTGTCEVSPRNEIIVKEYEDSYNKLFIIYTESDKQGLRPINGADLTPGEFIEVYTGEVSSYNVFNSNVYKDDPNDKADYVMLSSKGEKPITYDNALINNEGEVAPQQDSETFRQIVESSLKIEATES